MVTVPDVLAALLPALLVTVAPPDFSTVMSEAVTSGVAAPDTPESPFAALFNATFLAVIWAAIVVVVTASTLLDVI